MGFKRSPIRSLCIFVFMINFFCKDKTKSQTAIEAIVRHKGKRFKISTGLSVNTQYWDVKKHRCKVVREYPESKIVNLILDKKEVEIKAVLNGLQLKGAEVSAASVKASLFKGDKANGANIGSLFDDHLTGSEYSGLTRKKYITAKGWIIRYQQHRRTVFQAQDIDQAWYDGFKRYFFSQTYEKQTGKHHYTLNYFGSIIKCLKVVLKTAGKDCKISDDVNQKAFRTEEEESESVYLNESELKRIIDFAPTSENIGITDNRPQNVRQKIEALNITKNRFLIGCYTALRVSDFNRIDSINMKDGFIRIKPKKGRKLNSDIVIPIHPVVRAILESGFDFSAKISEQKINRHIKEICRIVGINEIVSITRTEGGKHVERTYEKWQLITTHTARRSGATNMYKSCIPSISIMKITGHKTERSFMKYIKISAEENAELLSKHSFFK